MRAALVRFVVRARAPRWAREGLPGDEEEGPEGLLGQWA